MYKTCESGEKTLNEIMKMKERNKETINGKETKKTIGKQKKEENKSL